MRYSRGFEIDLASTELLNSIKKRDYFRLRKLIPFGLYSEFDNFNYLKFPLNFSLNSKKSGIETPDT